VRSEGLYVNKKSTDSSWDRTGVNLQWMDKRMETVVKDRHFFITMELGQHLSIIELVSCLE